MKGGRARLAGPERRLSVPFRVGWTRRGPSDLALAQHFHTASSSSSLAQTSICSLALSLSGWYQHPKLIPHPLALLP